MKKIIVFILGVFIYQNSYTQTTAIDLLKKKLSQSKDTARINALIDLAGAYKEQYKNTRTNIDLDSSRHFANEALALARQINYIKGIGFSLFNLGDVTSSAPENQLAALTEYQMALPFLKQYGDKYTIAACLGGIGEANHTIGRLKEAIVYFDSVNQIVQAFGNTGWSVYAVSMKGHCYFDLGDYRMAYKVGNDALELAEKNKKDTGSICMALVQLANLFLGAGLPQTTIDYYHKIINYYPSALERARDDLPWAVNVAKLRAGEAFLQMNQLDSAINLSKIMHFDTTEGDDQLFLGHLCNAQHQYQEALLFFTRGLRVETEPGHLIGMARHADELARTYLILGNFDLAIKYANDALATGTKMHALLEMTLATGTLLDIYTKRKNYEQIYNYSQLYKSLKDSLSSEEYRRKLVLVQIQNELDNQKQQAVLLGKDNELKNQELSKEALARKFFIGGIIAVLIIAVIIFRNYRQKQRANFALQHQKEKVESTLSELRSTQAQLIQSAKMASLGELTAGIAHEIQNPLNFVNNFSEVNKELLTEMSDEIQKGNFDEIKTLVKDITNNEEKINHHGQRAAAIVKGMLQHSSAVSGKRELRDINGLTDEYLKLAYQGFRSKNSSFNATINTYFDGNIGNVNIIPQDIGRVLLNLYNNAFYAVAEKKKQIGEGYEPTLSVSTSKTKGGVIIKVKDNGKGIPANLLDKIFQPFFTTKPTGEGTGLGLSLAYDIVKAQGGELKVETKEGEGSEFTIELPAV